MDRSFLTLVPLEYCDIYSPILVGLKVVDILGLINFSSWNNILSLMVYCLVGAVDSEEKLHVKTT